MRHFLAVQEQLCERDQTIHELERKIEDKDRELQSIKLDNEAVCCFFPHACFVSLRMLKTIFLHSLLF